MNWIFLVVFLSAFVDLCYSNDVCEGPARFYCKNIRTAGSCQNKCLTHWSQSKWVPYMNDVSANCVYCLVFYDPASNMRDAHKLCTINHSEDECAYLLENWERNITNKDDKVAFCNVISMCNSHTYLGDLNFGSSVCEDCKKIMTDIRALLEDKATSDAIVEKLNALVCDRIPSGFRDYCKETVKSHVPAILHLIELQLLPTDLCSLIGLCSMRTSINVTIGDLLPKQKPSTSENVFTHTKCDRDTLTPWYYENGTQNQRIFGQDAYSEKPSCDSCKAVLGQIRQVLNDPKFREQIKQNIDEKICSDLPTFLRTACTNAVNVHFDDIMKTLNKADLGEICATFGMCPASQHSPSLQLPLQPGIPVPGVCQICEVVFHKLMTMLISDMSEKSIASALENVCSLVPQVYKSRCDAFIQQYGAKIIEAIIEGTAPKILCTAVGLCGPFPIHQTPTPQETAKIEPCSACKIIVTVVQQQLSLNQTKEGLESAVKQLCGLLPGSYAEECKTLVDIYLPTVIDYLSKSMTPGEICQEIGLCKSPIQLTRVDDQDITPLCKSDDLDVVCVSLDVARKCDLLDACLIYRQARHLSESTRDPAITSSGCSVCAELVSRWKLFKRLYGQLMENGHSCGNYRYASDRALCQLVVDNRFKIQHKLMDSSIDTLELCRQLDLCASDPHRPETIFPVDQSTQGQIVICSMDYQQLCASERMAALCGITNVCRAFGPTTKKPLRPVDVFGGDACHWGPSYYCQSEHHAQLCGPEAVKHCREKVWKAEAQDTTTTAKHHVGGNPCMRGPAYWCSDEQNAKSCGPHAVAHCRRMALGRSP